MRSRALSGLRNDIAQIKNFTSRHFRLCPLLSSVPADPDWIRIFNGLLDPDPYSEYGSGSSYLKYILNVKNYKKHYSIGRVMFK